MEPDRLAGKSQLWIPVAILTAAALLSYFVMKNVHRIDPQRFKGTSPSSFRRLAIAMAVFISVLNLLIVMSSAAAGHAPVKLMLPVIGLFFAVIGNYMPATKPNFWVGFRLPWIMRNADNWRKTHQLAGKLWFWGGLLFTFVSLFLPVKAAFPVLISLVLVMIIIPLVYSLTLLKKPNPNA
jgi:uncharacterized membrane protein